MDVTLCWLSAKKTITLSVLAQNQTKGLDSRSQLDRSRKGTPVRD